jgi:predicted double-glycine peptidase
LIETTGVVGLAAAGVAAGRWCSTWRKPWWLMGYVVSLVLMIVIAAARWFPRLELSPPFAWVMAGRLEFALLAPVVALLLTTPLMRLPRRRERALLAVFMVACVGGFSVLPFLLPAFNYRHLAGLRTQIDTDGVCIQGNGYTCGPAAAVTALREIGVTAEEGTLAIAAHTTRAAGTPSDSLCSAIRSEYGVDCRQMYFRSIDELRGKEPVIAVVKYAFLIDHYVTVLDVTDSTVVIGDPLVGRGELTYKEFAQKWRKHGIVLDRPSAKGKPSM